jgi:hypothetical protein
MRRRIFGYLAMAIVYALPAGVSAAEPLADRTLDWVSQCGNFGVGFILVPDTGTCVKVGGRVRAEYRVANDLIAGHNSEWRYRARAYLRIDARQNTDFGLLRSYMNLYWTLDEKNTSIDEAETRLTIDNAYIRLGGLTAGRATSRYDFYITPVFSAGLEPAHADDEANLLAYTFSAARFSSTVSLESTSKRINIATAAPGLLPPDKLDARGRRVADLIVATRVDLGGVRAQVMGALRYNDTLIPGVSAKAGWALGAGVIIELPWLGTNDEFGIQAAYSKGAVGYTYATTSTTVSDYFVTASGTIAQPTAWSVAAGYRHRWSPTWVSGFGGSYLRIEQPSGSTPSLTQWDLQSNLVFSPFRGMQLGFEVEWRKSLMPGSADTTSLQSLFRAQRTF